MLIRQFHLISGDLNFPIERKLQILELCTISINIFITKLTYDINNPNIP